MVAHPLHLVFAIISGIASAEAGVLTFDLDGGGVGSMAIGFDRYGEYGSTGLLSQDKRRSDPFSIKFIGADWQLIQTVGQGHSFGVLANTYYTMTLWVYSDVAGQTFRTEFLKHEPNNFGRTAPFRGTLNVATSKGDDFAKYHITVQGSWKKYTHKFYTTAGWPNVRFNIGTSKATAGPVYIAEISLEGSGVGISTTTATTQTTTTSTGTTTTTISTTTDTVLQILKRNVSSHTERVEQIEELLIGNQKKIENQILGLESELQGLVNDNVQLTNTNANLQAQLNAVIQRLVVLETKLTPDGDDGKLFVPASTVLAECDPTACTASIESSVFGLSVDACCDELVLREGRCVVEPCELKDRLDALQIKLGL